MDSFYELRNIMVKPSEDINRNKLLQMFTMEKLWFPLISSVIEKKQTGEIYVNDKSNPTHAFVINKFGFCQEAYEEYDDIFFENVIQTYIESKDRIKLRMYDPGRRMRQYLSSCAFASESTRVHMMHTYQNTWEEKSLAYVIRTMTKEDVMKDDLGLGLANRYYDGVDDFVEKAEAVAAYSSDGETIGVVYSAGEALGVCEKDILVKPQFRGAGIGKQLTEAFIRRCSEHNKLVSEDIYANNYASIALAKSTRAEFIAEYSYFNIEQI